MYQYFLHTTRSAKTSNRAQTPLITLYVCVFLGTSDPADVKRRRAGQAFNFAFWPYGQSWRTHRRMFWQHFHPGRMTSYWPVQREVTRKFLVKLLDKSVDLHKAIQ